MVRCLDRLAADRGAPVYVRFDNGPEFIAHAVADWCRFNGTGTVFIDPGSPWQNAWIESFNGRMRDEHLNGQQFDSLLEAKILAENWRIDYNMNRPQERTRLAHPSRVRRGLAPPTGTPARIAGGSTIGVRSRCSTFVMQWRPLRSGSAATKSSSAAFADPPAPSDLSATATCPQV